MKSSWIIFKTDIQSICKNWVAAILIGGLIFLPSLYAWANIYASWDPYAQTSQLPVAVVNEDTGTNIRGEQISIGNELMKTLKNNHDMKWNFTFRKEAFDELKYGNYFAVIIIPEDFSTKLASVLSDHPEKADIEYYVNEKINSIAPKITEKGAGTIVDKVSGQFIATVNGVIFDFFNDLGIEIEKDMPDIKNFEDYVMKMQKELPAIHELLVGTQDDVASAETLINNAQSLMPQAKTITSEGIGAIDNTIAFLEKAQNRLNNMASIIDSDLEKITKIIKETNKFLQKVQALKLNSTELDRIKEELHQKMNLTIQTVDDINDDLNWLNNLNEQEKLTDAIHKTENLKMLLLEAQTNINTVNTLIENKNQQMQNSFNDLHTMAQNTSIQLDVWIKEYKNTIAPTILSEINTAKNTLQNANALLTNIQTTLPEIEHVLKNTESHIKDGKKILDYTLAQYPYINKKVNDLAERIKKIQEKTDINEIIQLLRNDPQAERSFFEEPIILTENKLFPIANYGTGMTPFYTVLAIWVGCLLLISLLATDVKQSQTINKRVVYLGRLFTFSAIGLLQTLIVTIGDIVLVGVDVKASYLFILFGCLISIVFISIVYTLVSVFGDVGKALAIVMLVLQIAGSGGTYPVVLLPSFFQWINPFLPFTYAVSLMREAVGGIVWKTVILDISFLILFGFAFLLFGAFLKEKVNRKTNELLKKSRESGLFH